jgi:hypothetical protein
VRDETDRLQNAQMLRDRRSAHRELGCKVADRSRPRAEELEDLPSRRIAERVERMTVSTHLP